MVGTEAVVADLKRYEGFEGFPYDDSLGKPTIGIGCLLPLSQDEAEVLAMMRLYDTLTEMAPVLDGLPAELKPAAREVLVDMAYNLGVPRLKGFKRMFAALQGLDYKAAADEMLDSRWASQVGIRATELSAKMRNAGR